MHRRSGLFAPSLRVGAAFDSLSGSTPRALRWMHHASLERLQSLSSEPQRLGCRYLNINVRFLALSRAHLAQFRRSSGA